MSIVETERSDGIMIIRLNRPERMNALGIELRAAMADAFTEFAEGPEEVREYWQSLERRRKLDK